MAAWLVDMTNTAPWLVAGAALTLIASLPHWLPRMVVALRTRIFAWVNGDEGIPVPGSQIPVDEFKRVYSHPAANGRSRGAALSDLFWYWLSPGAEVHQEHLEPGPRYDSVARATRQILATLSMQEWATLVTGCTRRVLDEREAAGPLREVRLRDLMMPIWAEVYFELVFGEQCPSDARKLIVGNAEDVVNALKCVRLRHMRRRARLTGYLRDRLAQAPPPVPLPSLLSTEEQVYYLQGTFFNTAVVQMSEAMAHLLLVIATHRELQDRLVSRMQDQELLDSVINETLRVYPLFGVAHRITSAEIERPDGTAVPAGSTLLFNYTAYQHAGSPTAGRFNPERWMEPGIRPANFIPFGVAANRPCPARGFATATMRVVAVEVLRRYHLASVAGHTRSLPNRGPCLLVPHAAVGSWRPWRRAARLTVMRLRDHWEGVPRSIVQLVLGTFMVWDAQRQGLCRRYFASAGPASAGPASTRAAPSGADLCPAAPTGPNPGPGSTTRARPIS